MNILGISAFYHDSAACLVRDGVILCAAQEERFTRKKHDASFPARAIDFCLTEAGVAAKDLDIVAFYDKPFIKFERILQTYLQFAPAGFASFIMAMPMWVKEKIWMKELIARKLGFAGKIIFPEHHESHAASAFYPSPFQEAAFLTMDGVGEWTTTSYGVGKNNRIEIMAEQHFPHSLGLLYSAFTYFTGFRVNSGEYKLMGLAPYGEPKYRDVIVDKIVDIKDDGSFRLDMRYFNYCAGLTMTNARFASLFGGPARAPESEVTQREMDMARSIQDVTEEIVLRTARHVRKETGMTRLCLAGGVALNCVANGRLLREGVFEEIWIQPAAGDAGGALGAAVFAWHQYLDKPRVSSGNCDSQQGSYLGPRVTTAEVKEWLLRDGVPFDEVDVKDLPDRVAGLLAQEKVVGWFSGRMEFGPRALGGRSIIGDARSPKMQATMNLKIKFRESFRPFAPSVLADKAGEWFELDAVSPYMLLVAGVRPERRTEMTPDQQRLFGIDKLNVARSSIPAVTHVDYSARIQTVHRETNPAYYDVIKAFEARTGCPVIINTSFNVRGEPIVCTPQDAYRCFMRTNMDYLVIENLILDKTQQKALAGDGDWKKEFALD